MVGDILQPTHLLFVLVIALLVLGPKRLPEVGQKLGAGIRDFRAALNGEPERHEEISARYQEPQAQPAPGYAPPAQAGYAPPAQAGYAPQAGYEPPRQAPAPAPAPVQTAYEPAPTAPVERQAEYESAPPALALSGEHRAPPVEDRFVPDAPAPSRQHEYAGGSGAPAPAHDAEQSVPAPRDPAA